MVIESLLIGLILGFVFYELTGISAGGVIAPGYFALFVSEPDRILVTILLALAVWGVIELLSPRLVLYGRRRLLLALLLGFCGKLALDQWLQPMGVLGMDLQSIGYLIPGLIAAEMARQRPLPTLAGVVAVTALVALVLVAFRGPAA